MTAFLGIRDAFVEYFTAELDSASVGYHILQSHKDVMKEDAVNVKFLSDTPIAGKYPDCIIDTMISIDIVANGNTDEFAERQAMIMVQSVLTILSAGRYIKTGIVLTWLIKGLVFTDVPSETYVHKTLMLTVRSTYLTTI